MRGAERIRPCARERERGAALLTVLLLVAVIAVMAGTALERLRLSTRLTANAVAADAAHGYAFAAETLATTRVTALLRQAQAQAGGRVALAGGWSGRPFGLPVPGGSATARVTDGGNCFNLNGLVRRNPDQSLSADPTAVAHFARLLVLLRVPGAEGVAAAAADWIDSDDVPLPGGAEDGAYRGYRTAGTLMADVSEMRAVQGVTPEVYRALRPWLCTLPLPERSVLNVNTLAPEQAPLVAALLPDAAGAQAVGAVLLRRPDTGYGSIDQFWNQLSTLGGGGGGAAAPDARAQTATKTQWFALAIDVANAGTELHEQALIDARTLPVRLVSRQWGDAP